MNPYRRTSIAAGTLFVLATIAALAAAALDPTLTGTGHLSAVANLHGRLAVAALCYLIAAGTSVGIALALYPVLRRVNGTLALASVVFRAIEAVFYAIAVVSLLSVLPTGNDPATALANTPTVQASADVLLSLRDRATLVGALAFTVGSSLYYLLFYLSRLIPRWLSGWGILGVLLMMTASMLALFSNQPVTGYTLLILPILVQELVLAVWLLIRGFHPSPLTLGASSKDSTPVTHTASAPAAVS